MTVPEGAQQEAFAAQPPAPADPSEGPPPPTVMTTPSVAPPTGNAMSTPVPLPPGAQTRAVPFAPPAHYQPLPGYQPPNGFQPPHYQPPHAQPPDGAGEMNNESAHMLGLSVVAAGIGGALGLKYGGGYGAAAGVLFGGSVVNSYRAYKYFLEGTDEAAEEAQVSGLYAVATLVAGGVLWNQLVESTAAKPNAVPALSPEESGERIEQLESAGYDVEEFDLDGVTVVTRSRPNPDDDDCDIRAAGP